MKRTVKTTVKGYNTQDGAGVKLYRVLDRNTYKDFDPILMLDSFDSNNYDDYKSGFPRHPHRGIETISYLEKGEMTHKDSLNNRDTISNGEVQWMTAGSGILHEEMFETPGQLRGVQLWLNLPSDQKMVHPEYNSVKDDVIEEVEIDGGVLRVLSGSYKTHKGFQNKYWPLDYYSVHLQKENKTVLDIAEDKKVILFTLKGNIKIADREITEKTAVVLSKGDSLEIQSLDEDVEVLVLSTKEQKEPIAWGGPIVMTTRADLAHAFKELEEGTFIKTKIDY